MYSNSIVRINIKSLGRADDTSEILGGLAIGLDATMINVAVRGRVRVRFVLVAMSTPDGRVPNEIASIGLGNAM